MSDSKPKIRAADFAEACQRFFRSTEEWFDIKTEPLPPPSPAVLEIMRGLREGWDANESVKEAKRRLQKPLP